MAFAGDEIGQVDNWGQVETQESEDDEAHPEKWTEQCTKHPGHTSYIDVDKLSLNDLPINHRHELFLNLVKVAAFLTFKIIVNKTSLNRPEFWPDSKKPYPFQKNAIVDKLRCASGRVWGILKYVDGIKDGEKQCSSFPTCPCKKCRLSETPRTTWWKITARTAAHVIYDDSEAEHACCTMFYDRSDSEVVELDNITVPYVNVEFDTAKLTLYTCDPEIAERLTQQLKNFNDIWDKMCELNSDAVSGVDKCVFVISHPHGMTKKLVLVSG
uniref:Uncharacterized protein n=1 Tax=Biomphalaria glabrata TaxID=6526 RepID=A0A2C9KJ66_BIOGL